MLTGHCLCFLPRIPCLVPNIRRMTQLQEAAACGTQVSGGALSKHACKGPASLTSCCLTEISPIFLIFFVKILPFHTYFQLRVLLVTQILSVIICRPLTRVGKNNLIKSPFYEMFKWDPLRRISSYALLNQKMNLDRQEALKSIYAVLFTCC